MKRLELGLSIALVLSAGCRDDPSSLPTARHEPPTNAAFALILDTKENMGCRVNQKLVENGLPELARSGIALGPGLAGEDSTTRQELYLGFAAPDNFGTSGHLAFRLWIEPGSPGEEPRAVIGRPNLDWNPNGIQLSLRASGKGQLRFEALWCGSPDLEQIWRTCPEADVREAFSGRFLIAHPLEPVLPRDAFTLAEDAQPILLRLSKGAASQLKQRTAAQKLLDQMAASYRVPESRWLWSAAKLNVKSLRERVARASGSFQVVIAPDTGPILATGDAEFPPCARFRLTLVETSGKRIGAEVRIGPRG